MAMQPEENSMLPAKKEGETESLSSPNLRTDGQWGLKERQWKRIQGRTLGKNLKGETMHSLPSSAE